MLMPSLLLGLGFLSALFFAGEIYTDSESTGGPNSQERLIPKKITPTYNRKLMSLLEAADDDGSGSGSGSMNRMGAACTKESIYIFQGPTSPLPNGIPTYTVQIENVCVSGSCSIADIHLSCGWFSSARLINPNIFRRICYDDCLVNNGEPLNPGESLSFQYANSFQYPMSVSSVACY